MFREAAYRRKHPADTGVKHLLAHARHIETLLSLHYGIELKGLDILDIGAGQLLLQMQYFARHNTVTGIDTNIIAQGFDPFAYAKMLSVNGPVRVAKTIMRKLMGIDGEVIRDLKTELGVDSLPKLPVHLMDACNLTFAESSFDFVHCHAVLHHVMEPATALKGIVRVLRPGGGFVHPGPPLQQRKRLSRSQGILGGMFGCARVGPPQAAVYAYRQFQRCPE